MDSPSGVQGYLARWSDDDTLGVSNVYESGGNVGIGTSSASHKLMFNMLMVTVLDFPIVIIAVL